MNRNLATRITDKALSKVGLGGDVTQEKVAKSCKMMFPLINIGAYPLFRATIDIDNGMIGEIAQLRASGKTSNEIIDFYWNIPEFQKVWGRVHFDKQHLIDLVN